MGWSKEGSFLILGDCLKDGSPPIMKTPVGGEEKVYHRILPLKKASERGGWGGNSGKRWPDSADGTGEGERLGRSTTG